MPNKVTRKRDFIINKSLLKKRRTLLVYNGKSFELVTLRNKTIGHKLGEFCVTKKLGAKIHNSERAKKRKNKKKQK